MDMRGITSDRETKFAVKMYKGSPKKRKTNAEGEEYEIFGDDLGENFRLAPANDLIRNILKRAYPNAKEAEVIVKKLGKEIKEVHLIIPSMVIYLWHDHPDEVFDGGMVTRKGKRIATVCNRQTIHHELINIKDRHGQVHPQMMPCDKPCELGDEERDLLAVDCPMGCKQEGTLLFTFPELQRAGIQWPCKLTTHGWKDITDIDASLREYARLYGRKEKESDEYGALNCARFSHPEYLLKLPFLISRSRVVATAPVMSKKEKITVAGKLKPKRTEERMERIDWVVTISPHPDYVRYHEMMESIAHDKKLGFAPDRRLLQAAGRDCIDVEIRADYPALKPVEAEPVEPIDDWRDNAYNAAIDRGLKPETAKAIANRAKDPTDFAKLLDGSIAINQAIDGGIEVAFARDMMAALLWDAQAFVDRVTAIKGAIDKGIDTSLAQNLMKSFKWDIQSFGDRVNALLAEASQ